MMMDFVANFMHFPAVKTFENWLRFDKVTDSLKVGTILRHSVVTNSNYATVCITMTSS